MRRADSSHQPTRQQLMKTIAAAARQARKHRGLTQADVADEIGISAECYGRIDRGLVLPSIRTFYAIAVALEINPNQLLGLPMPEPATASLVRPQRPAGTYGATQERPEPELRRLLRQLRKASPQTLQITEWLLKQIDRSHSTTPRTRRVATNAARATRR